MLGHIDHRFIFQMSLLLSGLALGPVVPSSCDLTLALLFSLTPEIKDSLKTLPLGHLVSLGKCRVGVAASRTRCFGKLVKVQDPLTGRGGLGLILGWTRGCGFGHPNASWTWFIAVVFIMASRWHQEEWSPCQCES